MVRDHEMEQLVDYYVLADISVQSQQFGVKAMPNARALQALRRRDQNRAAARPPRAARRTNRSLERKLKCGPGRSYIRWDWPSDRLNRYVHVLDMFLGYVQKTQYFGHVTPPAR